MAKISEPTGQLDYQMSNAETTSKIQKNWLPKTEINCQL